MPGHRVVCITTDSRRPDAGGRGECVFVRGPVRCLGSPLASRWAVHLAHVSPAGRRGSWFQRTDALAEVPAACGGPAGGTCHVLEVPRTAYEPVRRSQAQFPLTSGKGLSSTWTRIDRGIGEPMLRGPGCQGLARDGICTLTTPTRSVKPGVHWANDWMSSSRAGTWCRCSAQRKATHSSKPRPVSWD